MMAKQPNNGRDNSGDQTEYFARPDNNGSSSVSGTDKTEYIPRPDGYNDQDYGYGYDNYGYEDETRTFDQKPQETEFFDRPPQQPVNHAPRQQFPEGYDPVSGTYAPGYGPEARRQQEAAYQQQPAGQQYQQPVPPQHHEPRPRKKKSGGGGFIALGFLLGLALLAAIAFFLLWRNSESAPAPTPVTETATVTQTVEPTPTTTREPLLPTQLPELPSDVIPTELPNIELPSEVQNFDIEGFLNDLVGGQGQPAPPAQ